MVSNGRGRDYREVVQSKGNLRDLCLFMLLMTGQRASSIRMVRFRDISKMDSGALVTLTTAKTTDRECVAFLPHRFMDMVTEYKRQANLSEDDHLFHSRAGASIPMHQSTLNRLVLDYLHAAVLNPALRSVYMFRKSVVFNHKKSSQLPHPDVPKQMDHHWYSDRTLREK